jgi:hypothetical protein
MTGKRKKAVAKPSPKKTKAKAKAKRQLKRKRKKTSARVEGGSRGRSEKPTAGGRVKSAPTKSTLPEFSAAVKKKAPASRPSPKPAKPTKRAPPPSSQAIRARKRRAEAKAIAKALEAARQEKLARRRERDRARRAKAKLPPPTEAELAVGWMERIRDDVSEVALTDMAIVSHNPDDPNLWIIVGRFDFRESVDYETMGAVLDAVAGDIELEAMVHPMRLSQVRIGYHDPTARSRESDGTISSIGAWQYILGELTGEISGSGDDDLNALAVRYQESRIGAFWVYFSGDVRNYQTVMPGQKTATVPLRR